LNIVVLKTEGEEEEVSTNMKIIRKPRESRKVEDLCQTKKSKQVQQMIKKQADKDIGDIMGIFNSSLNVCKSFERLK